MSHPKFIKPVLGIACDLVLMILPDWCIDHRDAVSSWSPARRKKQNFVNNFSAAIKSWFRGCRGDVKAVSVSDLSITAT